MGFRQAAAAACVVITVCVSAAEPPETRSPAVSCESLAGRMFYNVTVSGAQAVPATATLPAYCKVSGHEPGTEHDLEIRLPELWRGRYVQRGGGGFDGSIVPAAAAPDALRLGAVQGANNGGHRDPTGAALLNNPRAIERYAHGAILIATRFGKAVTEAYYGHAPEHSYYDGCSNGGRGALNAAAKYGTEFDGVIAVAPTVNLTGQIVAWTAASALSMPSAAQFAQIHSAAVSKCDALDGLKDGIIARWQSCDFDPRKDVPAKVGLSAAQVVAARTLMQDLQRADGSIVYSGFGLGDMALGAPSFGLFGVGQMRSIVLDNAQWQPEDFNVAKYEPVISATIDAKYQFSAQQAGLVQFMRSGGKVIVWHGSDDALLSHRDTIRTWADLTRAAGAQTARENARFYIAPGVAHCAGGPGADTVASLSAMMDWVEQGKAPATLLATKRDPRTGATRFTRPLCEYPGWPRYKGKGDESSAESFECVTDR